RSSRASPTRRNSLRSSRASCRRGPPNSRQRRMGRAPRCGGIRGGAGACRRSRTAPHGAGVVTRRGNTGRGGLTRFAGEHPPVQGFHLLIEPRYGAADGDLWRYLLNRERRNRAGFEAPFSQPGDELLGGVHVHNVAEADPRVGGRAHRAVFAGGVDGCFRPLLRTHVLRRPPGEAEFRVPGLIAAGDPVAILGADVSRRVDEDGAEGSVPGLECLAAKLDAAAKVRHFTIIKSHSASRVSGGGCFRRETLLPLTKRHPSSTHFGVILTCAEGRTAGPRR